jgi:hypothetical protein
MIILYLALAVLAVYSLRQLRIVAAEGWRNTIEENVAEFNDLLVELHARRHRQRGGDVIVISREVRHDG